VVSQKLTPKLGRYVISLGTVVMAIGVALEGWLMLHFGLDLQPWQLMPALFVAGFGAGMIMAPIFSVVLTDVDVRHAGSASGVLNAVQQVGGAVGVALIGVVFFGLLNHGAHSQASQVTAQLRSDLAAAGVPAAAQHALAEQFLMCFQDRNAQKDASAVPASCRPAGTMGAMGAVGGPEARPLPATTTQAIGEALQRAGKTANAHNFARAFGWSIAYEVVLLVVVFALTFLLPRRIRPEAMEMAG
jgi:hypothetical protein